MTSVIQLVRYSVNKGNDNLIYSVYDHGESYLDKIVWIQSQYFSQMNNILHFHLNDKVIIGRMFFWNGTIDYNYITPSYIYYWGCIVTASLVHDYMFIIGENG